MAVNRYESRVGRAAQQAIQLVQLAALAFLSDPLALSFVPESAAVEQQETSAFRGRSVTLIQALDACGGGGEKRVIIRRIMGSRVGPVRQQR